MMWQHYRGRLAYQDSFASQLRAVVESKVMLACVFSLAQRPQTFFQGVRSPRPVKAVSPASLLPGCEHVTLMILAAGIFHKRDSAANRLKLLLRKLCCGEITSKHVLQG